MSLFKRFINLFKKDSDNVLDEVIETMESVDAPKEVKSTPIRSELIYDYNLRYELKKIAKAQNKTMGEIVNDLVKNYIHDYYGTSPSLDSFKKEPETIDESKLSECAFCGKKFKKSHNSEKYCSDDCRLSVRRASQRKYDAKKRKEIRPSVYHRGKKTRLETLPNGLKLRAVDCDVYNPLPWWTGNGNIHYGNGQLCPFSLSQLLDLKRNFDKIPKNPGKERIEWFETRYNIKLKSFDRMLWNLYKGTFDHIFEAYYQKNYAIRFDKNGSLSIGE